MSDPTTEDAPDVDVLDAPGDEVGDDDEENAGGIAYDVLDYLARSLVDDADAVEIEVEDGRNGPILRLHVAPADMGKVIGRRGHVAQAIRTVVRAAAARDGGDCSVDIVD